MVFVHTFTPNHNVQIYTFDEETKRITPTYLNPFFMEGSPQGLSPKREAPRGATSRLHVRGSTQHGDSLMFQTYIDASLLQSSFN